MPEMRMHPETITWMPSAWPRRPDVDTTVLICTKDGQLITGFWDDNDMEWCDDIEGGYIEALYWAHVNGPEVEGGR